MCRWQTRCAARYIDVANLPRAVDSHGIVVPAVVAVAARYDELTAIRAVFQFLTLKADEELLVRRHIGLLARAVAQQGTTSAGCGLKPEHQRIVGLITTRQVLRLHLQTLHVALLVIVQTQRHATGLRPVSTIQQEMSALSRIGSIAACAVVHGIIVQQAEFVACQQSLAVAVQQG